MNRNINKAIRKLTPHNYLLIRVGTGDVLSTFDSLTNCFHMDFIEKNRNFVKEFSSRRPILLLLNTKTMELYHYADTDANINVMYSMWIKDDMYSQMDAKQVLRFIKLTKLNERILSI